MLQIREFQVSFIIFIFKRFKPSTFAFFTSAFSSAMWSTLIIKIVSKGSPILLIASVILLYLIGIALGLYLITLLEKLKEEVDYIVQSAMNEEYNVRKISTYKEAALSRILKDPDSHIKIFWVTIFFIIFILLGYITSFLANSI